MKGVRMGKPKYDQILVAAYHLLATVNYQNMTTARIAEAAGVAEGTLYRYFKNKRQLLFEVLKHFGDQIMEKIFQKVSPQQSYMQNLHHFADAFQDSLQRDIPFYRIMYKAFSELDDPEIFPALRDYFIAQLDKIREVFEWSVQRGEITVDSADLDLIVQHLWGIADGFMKRTILQINLPIQQREIEFTLSLMQAAINKELQ
ncbi:MAG TPA: TetR/AcrR family transcriptional regulator [Candidatus Marinimicrobia bacterium]|nr:TetR/AcrR family transcriptional regulator [Candidatus Neomarinimicrobiota bacterium]